MNLIFIEPIYTRGQYTYFIDEEIECFSKFFRLLQFGPTLGKLVIMQMVYKMIWFAVNSV